MKDYPKYKDSGIEWLGEVPEHWGIASFKMLGNFKSGAGFPDDEQGLLEEEIPFYKVSDTNNEGNDVYMLTHNNSISLGTAKKLRAYIFPPNTIIFAKVGAALLLNKHRILTNNSCIDNNMMGFMSDNCNTLWCYFWLNQLDLGKLVNPGAVPSINEKQLNDLPLCIPHINEQKAIATFLDRETARIDALIQKKERMIELLKEKRVALITQAVTKGLDPNVPMKDSGIEWLGEVPEHWEVLPIKYIVSTPVTDGPHETPEILDEGVPFISAESIKGGKIDFELKRGFISIEDDLRYSKKYKPMMNDIYVIKSGATTGNSAMVETDIEFNIWSPLAVIRCNKVIADPHFVFLYVNSNEFITAIQLFWSFGTQQNIGMNIIENLQVRLPPISEQINICKGSKMELERIEALQNKIADSISLLREYRSSLIHHAVTGKIDLRGYDAQAQ